MTITIVNYRPLPTISEFLLTWNTNEDQNYGRYFYVLLNVSAII